MRSRKLYRWILTVAVVCAVLFMAQVVGAATSGDFEYEVLEDGTASITGFVGEANVDLVIPDEIDGYTVTQIGDNAFDGYSEFTGNLVLPDNLISIGFSAFNGCSGFTGNLILPYSLTTIEPYAFSGCSGFTGDLIIPDNVISVGYYAFAYCGGFTGNLVLPKYLTSIENGAFRACGRFTGNLVLPNGITSIGDEAFSNCSGFTGHLVFPDSLTFIGDNAFILCSGFTGNLVIPDGVTFIGDNAFNYCIGFAGNLILSDSLKTIGNTAFSYCSGFTGNLVIPDGVTFIGEYAFGSNGFTGSLTLSKSLISIGMGAFSNCSGFTGNLVLPNSLTSIGGGAFNNCSGFTGNLILPNSITTIGNSAFFNCSGFTGSLVLSNSLTSIGNHVFSGCSGFTGNLILPNSITSIGPGAFSACSGFTGDLVLSDSLTTIEMNAFSNCSGITGDLVIPAGVTTIEGYAFSFNRNIKRNVIFMGNVPQEWGGNYVFGENRGNVTIYYPAGNTSGWTSPEWKGFKTATHRLNENGDLGNSTLQPSLGSAVPYVHTYTIGVADKDTGKVLQNATVQYGGIIKQTDINGFAYIQADQYLSGLSVTLDGYIPYNNPNFSFSGNRVVEYIQLTKDTSDNGESDAVLLPYTCNGINIETGMAQINNMIRDTAEIVVNGISDTGILEYTLEQDGIVLERSNDGIFRIPNVDFSEGTPIKATMTTTDGKTVSEILKISVTAFSFNDIIFPLSGSESIRIPESIALFGGMEFDISIRNITFDVKVTNDELLIGLNIPLNKETDNRPLLERLKELGDQLINWENYAGKNDKAKDFEFTIGGYLAVQMGNTGIKQVKGEITIVGSYTNSFGKTIPIPVMAVTIPVRVEMEFNARGELHITTLGYDFEKAKILLPNLDFAVASALTLRCGIGTGLASAGIYGKAGITFDFALVPQFYVREILSNGQLGIYAKVDIGMFNIDSTFQYSLIDEEFVLYKRQDNLSTKTTSEYENFTLYNMEDYNWNDRSYLSANAEVEPISIVTQSTDGQSYTTLQTSTYDGSDPQIVTAGGITMMAYLRDNGGTDPYNFQQLVFSLWDETTQTWSEPTPVDSNAFVDADFCLETDGKTIWIAYTEASRALIEADTLTSTASVFEIVAAKFDGSSFTGHTTLTKNSCYDSSPVLSVNGDSVSVAWLTNSANNVFGMEGTNTISLAAYNGAWDTTVVEDKVATVTGLDVGMYNNTLTIAAVHDADNNLTTSDDRVLKNYINGVQNTLSATTFIDCPTVTEDAIFWYENNTIRSSKSTEPLLALSADCSSSFQLTDNAILFTVHNTEGENGGSDVWASFRNADGTYGTPTRLTRTEGYVDSFGAVPYNGGLLIPYRRTDVTFTEDSFTTVSSLESMLYTQSQDLRLDNVYFDLDDLTDDGNVTFTVWVTNTGAMDVTVLQMSVDGAQIGTISQTIQAGESAEVTIAHEVPAGTESISVTISAADEAYLADNVQTVQLAYADIAVTAEQRIIAEQDYLLVTVMNTGSANGSGTLTIHEDNADGTVILSEDYSLAAGQSTYALYPMDDARFDGYRSSLLYAEAAVTQEDYNLVNNSDAVKMFSFRDWGITLAHVEQNLQVSVTAPDAAVPCTLIVAQYANGRMLESQVFALETGAYTDGIYDTNVAVCESGDTCRAFLLDSALSPVCSAAELTY